MEHRQIYMAPIIILIIAAVRGLKYNVIQSHATATVHSTYTWSANIFQPRNKLMSVNQIIQWLVWKGFSVCVIW